MELKTVKGYAVVLLEKGRQFRVWLHGSEEDALNHARNMFLCDNVTVTEVTEAEVGAYILAAVTTAIQALTGASTVIVDDVAKEVRAATQGEGTRVLVVEYEVWTPA